MNHGVEELAFALLEQRYAELIAAYVLNIAMPLEDWGLRIPVLFGSRELLLDWALDAGFRWQRIGNARPTSAMLIKADHDHQMSGYEQIWVRTGFGGYKHALRSVAQSRFAMSIDDLENVDADHVVNRARLQTIRDSWVCLFPVVDRANRPFGNIEKQLPSIAAVERMELEPLIALKLFCNRMPKTASQLEQVMEDIKGKILPTEHSNAFLTEMRKLASTYMRTDEAAARSEVL